MAVIDDDSSGDDFIDEGLIDAGVASADLIADPKTWINRRVETVEMLSQEETRRRVSIDFTLSEEQRAALTTRHGVIVPISVLSKHPRRNFDLRDERGASLPVLGRNDNGNLALIALLSAASGAINDTSQDDPLDDLADDFRAIIFAPDAAALDALWAFVAGAQSADAVRAAVWNDTACSSLLRTLATDYVLFAALAADGPGRRVLKYSYGDELRLEPPWERRQDKYSVNELSWSARNPGRTRFLIDCPGAWRASSFHMEIAIPEELRVAYAELGRVTVEDDVEIIGPPDQLANRAALYAAEDVAPHETCARTLKSFRNAKAEPPERPSRRSPWLACSGSDGGRGLMHLSREQRCRCFSRAARSYPVLLLRPAATSSSTRSFGAGAGRSRWLRYAP